MCIILSSKSYTTCIKLRTQYNKTIDTPILLFGCILCIDYIRTQYNTTIDTPNLLFFQYIGGVTSFDFAICHGTLYLKI